MGHSARGLFLSYYVTSARIRALKKAQTKGLGLWLKIGCNVTRALLDHEQFEWNK
jgi:hypothetical protein